MPVLHQHDNDSDAVKIAHEKEKTKRFSLYIGSIALVAVFGIYFVFRASDNSGTRKFDLDIKGGKIALSVDKPIVTQAGVATKEYESSKGESRFTTGKVDAGVIKQIESTQGPLSSEAFTGNNFINKEAGFLFTVDRPDRWKVIASPGGNERALIVNNLVSKDGNQNNLNVVIDNLPTPQSLQEYVAENVQQMVEMGMISQEPAVSYDLASNTAFLSCQNLQTGGPTFQKIILTGNRAYIATANRSRDGGDAQTLSDMVKMVESFTLIAS